MVETAHLIRQEAVADFYRSCFRVLLMPPQRPVPHRSRISY